MGGDPSCYGAAARFLGMLASTMSDWDAAEDHFNKAIELDSQMEAWPWLAYTKCEYAAMLLARDREADRSKANSLLKDSLTRARRMDMAYLAQKIKALFERHEFA